MSESRLSVLVVGQDSPGGIGTFIHQVTNDPWLRERADIEYLPTPIPVKWAGLVGEYGPDFNVVVILEKDGQLHTLIEWQFLYPLKQEEPG